MIRPPATPNATQEMWSIGSRGNPSARPLRPAAIRTGPMVPRPDQRIATASWGVDPSHVDEPVIERAEVVALLFNVSDIAASLEQIEQLLGEDDGEEEDDGS